MRTRMLTLFATLLGVAAVMAAPVHARGLTDPTEDIRQALLWLPYYGPFDALSFTYDRGTVTLEGQAYALGLKADAERVVKRVAGVDQVINRIEQLPPSPQDDQLRWQTFYAIYGNESLSRYAPGGSLFLDRRWLGRERDLGLEPFGTYPIHILVRNGHVELLGWVSSAADRTVANLAARGVAGSFGVENHLEVYPIA